MPKPNQPMRSPSSLPDWLQQTDEDLNLLDSEASDDDEDNYQQLPSFAAVHQAFGGKQSTPEDDLFSQLEDDLNELLNFDF
jgi:hypothetical protein